MMLRFGIFPRLEVIRGGKLTCGGVDAAGSFLGGAASAYMIPDGAKYPEAARAGVIDSGKSLGMSVG